MNQFSHNSCLRVNSGRSYSVSGFEFDLLPLTASMADTEIVQGSHGGEKNIGLLNGEPFRVIDS